MVRHSSLGRRLAKVEEQVANQARREKLANCNCWPQDPERIGIPLMVMKAKQFEAEMNLTCPVHGFRRLGKLLVLKFMNVDQTIAEESVRLGQLVEEYERRRSEFLKSRPDLEDDCEQF